MSISKEDEQAIARMYLQILRQRTKDKQNEAYYRGMQDIGNLGIAVPPEVEQFAFPLNWCRTYTDVIVERQDVRMILRKGENSEESDLRQDWDANDLDTEQIKFNRDMVVLGRAAISVGADPHGGIPIIRVESPKNLTVERDVVTRETTGALRVFYDTTGMAETFVLYRPNYTLVTSKKLGKQVQTQRIDHNLGRVPIIVMYNRSTSDDYNEGESLLNDLKPLVNMAGRVMLQLQLAMETVGTPQKVLLGATKKDFEDEDGNPVDPWETYLGAVWAVASDKAKIEQLSGANLTGFLEIIKMLAEQASTVTGMPVRMMGQNTANPAAEGAIRADESRLVKQIERLNRSAGTAWSWALGISEKIRTRKWGDGEIQVLYHDPGTPTEAQKADAMIKLNGNKPVLSVRGTMVEMGWSQQRIDQELSWLAEESQPLLHSLDRPFTQEEPVLSETEQAGDTP